MLRNRIYYGVKPFVPQRLRMAVRRTLAMRRRPHVADVWPIMPGSEYPPEGWRGWPGGKKFAVVLTHDVEGQRGLDQCRPLMELEMELGFRSSFNFIPEGNYRVPSAFRYELTRNGFEVGVHDLRHDGRLFRSVAEFRSRAICINQYLRDWNAVGFRSGFMLHNLDWLHNLDIEYDMSTFDTDPFEPQPDGRNTIFPFWVPRPPATEDGGSALRNSSFEIRHSAGGSKQHTNFSVSASQHPSVSPNGYVELPYTLPQDSTLFLLLGETTSDVWKGKLDWIAEHHGMVLLDTHPDYMNFNQAARSSGQYPVRFYRELLEYLRSNYADQYWHALPGALATYVQRLASREAIPSLNRFPAVSPEVKSPSLALNRRDSNQPSRLRGKRAAVLLFSYFPGDARPSRAAQALAAEGMTVDIICLQRDQTEPRRETMGGINVFRVPLKRCRGSKLRYLAQYSTFILRSFVQLAFHSVSRRYDLVHVHNMPDVLVFAALVPRMLGAKVILDLHDPMPELMQTIFGLKESSLSVRLLKRLESWSVGFADLAVTVNLACKRIYESRGCPPEKMIVVMNAPDDHVFKFQAPQSNGSNGSDPARPFSILYHGSLVPRNGLDLAVDALEIAKERVPAARLIVCGERSSFLEEVMASAEKRGLQDRVDYLGVKDRTGIVEAIQHCDLGVIPNHRNTFTEINTPTRIFEYLSLGKPVVAPRTLGIEDYFGKDALLFFDAGDSRDLARRIEFAYFNREETTRFVERGQEVYLANNWTRQKANFIHSIEELCRD